DGGQEVREKGTSRRHRVTGEPEKVNFAVVTKLQRKFSPLFVKRIATDWQGKTLRRLPNYLDARATELFRKTTAETVADFCLEMYTHMGLLDGIHVVRSSDPALRRSACEVRDYFVDVSYSGEIVRAR